MPESLWCQVSQLSCHMSLLGRRICRSRGAVQGRFETMMLTVLAIGRLMRCDVKPSAGDGKV